VATQRRFTDLTADVFSTVQERWKEGDVPVRVARHLYRRPRPCASNLTHSRVGRDNLSVYFAKMADDLVLENDVEAGKVTTRPVTENSYTDVCHGSVLE
jgi:hypothetical protein